MVPTWKMKTLPVAEKKTSVLGTKRAALIQIGFCITWSIKMQIHLFYICSKYCSIWPCSFRHGEISPCKISFLPKISWAISQNLFGLLTYTFPGRNAKLHGIITIPEQNDNLTAHFLYSKPSFLCRIQLERGEEMVNIFVANDSVGNIKPHRVCY